MPGHVHVAPRDMVHFVKGRRLQNVSRTAVGKCGLERTPGDRRRAANHCPIKPLAPEVARINHLANPLKKGSTPAASKSTIYLCINNLLGRLAGSRRLHYKTAYTLAFSCQ